MNRSLNIFQCSSGISFLEILFVVDKRSTFFFEKLHSGGGDCLLWEVIVPFRPLLFYLLRLLLVAIRKVPFVMGLKEILQLLLWLCFLICVEFSIKYLYDNYLDGIFLR